MVPLNFYEPNFWPVCCRKTVKIVRNNGVCSHDVPCNGVQSKVVANHHFVNRIGNRSLIRVVRFMKKIAGKVRRSYPPTSAIHRLIDAVRDKSIDIAGIGFSPTGEIQIFDHRAVAQMNASKDEFSAWEEKGLL